MSCADPAPEFMFHNVVPECNAHNTPTWEPLTIITLLTMQTT